MKVYTPYQRSSFCPVLETNAQWSQSGLRAHNTETVLLKVKNDFRLAAAAGWCSAVILLARSAGFNSAPLHFDRLPQKAAARLRGAENMFSCIRYIIRSFAAAASEADTSSYQSAVVQSLTQYWWTQLCSIHSQSLVSELIANTSCVCNHREIMKTALLLHVHRHTVHHLDGFSWEHAGIEFL